MSKALYRKYRPQNFDQVLGQDNIVSVLKNQIKTGKISHAYLFSGERGCGKTSCAKIFAKAVNCLNPVDGSPCNECENCRLIIDDQTTDIVEMDAASNRRIDDIRELREKVIYPPSKLKYKVYIIDEAHMITKEAFNALLKIMEEPPEHLIFILATTEIDKLPITILSRVQKFEFNSIDQLDIKKQIDIVLQNEDIFMDDESKTLIIEKANGAMRDALSILDQVISDGEKSYDIDKVQSLLGSTGFKDIHRLYENIILKNQKEALNTVFSIRENKKNNLDIIDELCDYFRDVFIYKTKNDFIHFMSEKKKEIIISDSNNINLDRLMDSLEILIDYKNRINESNSTDLLLELCIIRLIEYKNTKDIISRIEALERNENIDENRILSIIEERLSSANNIKIPKKISEKRNINEIKEQKEKSNVKVNNKINEDGNFNKNAFYSALVKMGPLYTSCIDIDDIIIENDQVDIYLDKGNFKSSEIEEKFKEITGKIIKVSIHKKNELKNNKQNEKRENNEEIKENTDRLKSIFGDYLKIK